MKNLEALLAPQERLDGLIAQAFKRFGPKRVDLSYANPSDGPDEEVQAVLRRAAAMKGQAAQYTPYGGRIVTRRAVADRLCRDLGLPFDFRDVVMTPGAMAGLNIAFRALFGGDDEVIVLTPCWHDYPLYLRALGIPFSLVPLGADKRLDLNAIRRALGPATKGLLLSQPCCPTGVLYSKEEIEGLAALLREAEGRLGAEIYWISDEVHRDMIWSRRSFHSPVLSYPRSLSIYSFGKALRLQGQRIGYVAVSPRMAEREEVRRTLERCARIMGFSTPTSLMQRAVCDLVDYRPPLEALAANQERVRKALAGCGYEVCRADATFFVYVKSPDADDFRFAELMASLGVLVAPSTLFHDPGYVRLCLTARSEAITHGLAAFAAVQERL